MRCFTRLHVPNRHVIDHALRSFRELGDLARHTDSTPEGKSKPRSESTAEADLRHLLESPHIEALNTDLYFLRQKYNIAAGVLLDHEPLGREHLVANTKWEAVILEARRQVKFFLLSWLTIDTAKVTAKV